MSLHIKNHTAANTEEETRRDDSGGAGDYIWTAPLWVRPPSAIALFFLVSQY